MSQLFQACFVAFTLLPHLSSVQRFIKLERKEGSSLKRTLEKVYLNAHLLKFKGDWLHFGFATLTIDREMVSQAVGAKMAVSLRGYDMNVYPLKFPGCYDVLWKQVNKVHAISNYMLNKGWLLGLSKYTPYQIITPAVNLSSLPNRHVQHSNGTFKVVTIARLNWIKGIDYLIEVADCLKKVHFNFEWQIIGSGENSETERYLYHLHEKGLERQVVLKGMLSHTETLNILATADVYVQTSLNEGFCNAVLEAQAIGVPCVAFKVGGLPENICDTKTGWLIEPYDLEAMAKSIIDVSYFGANEKEDFAELARKRVMEHFNLIQQKQGFNDFYTT